MTDPNTVMLDEAADESTGSLFDGIMVGLAIEAGFVAMVAWLVVQFRPFHWSLPFDPAHLLSVVLLAVALVGSVCIGPIHDPVGYLSGLIGGRRRAAVKLAKASHSLG